jgi:hypothetical protein
MLKSLAVPFVCLALLAGCGSSSTGKRDADADAGSEAGDARLDVADVAASDAMDGPTVGDAADGAVADGPIDAASDGVVADGSAADSAPDVHADGRDAEPGIPDAHADAQVGVPDAHADVQADQVVDTGSGTGGPDAPTVAVDASGDANDANDASAAPDAAIDAGGTDGPPAWTPRSLSNLVLWLEADRGIATTPGAPIDIWRDQSGRNNHAFQPDDASAPTLVVNAVNGLPAVRFRRPSWLVVADTQAMRWGTNDFTLLIVERGADPCPSCSGQQLLFVKHEQAPPYSGPQMVLSLPDGRIRYFLTLDAQDFLSTRPGYASGGTHLIGMRRSFGRLELRADGWPVATVVGHDPVNLDAAGSNAHIGAHGVAGDQWQFNGDIAAVVGIKGSLSVSEYAMLEEYLLRKYGVPTDAARDNPTDVAFGTRSDGRLEIAFNGPNDVLRAKTLAGAAAFDTWTDDLAGLDADGATRVAMAGNRDGLLELIYAGPDRLLSHATQTTSGSWRSAGLVVTPSMPVLDMTLAKNQDGRLHLVYLGMNATIYQRTQDTPGGAWGPERLVDQIWAKGKAIVMDRNADGTLEAVLIGTDDAFYFARQTSPGESTWSLGLVHPTATQGKALAMGRNADGRLELAHVGLDDALYVTSQAAPNGPWEAARLLIQPLVSAKQLAVGQNQDGRLAVVFVDTNGFLRVATQTTAGGSVWNLGVPHAVPAMAKRLAVARDSAGQLQVVFVGLDEMLYRTRQMSPNSATWTAVAPL